jgi:translation initiation factor 2B subunit (eIF-2B alpha/beta/delta family)
LNHVKDVSDFKACISEIIDKYKTESKDASQIIYQQAKKLLSVNMTVFTHSYSSTVVNAILESGTENLKVIVTESRPLNEGIETAKSLAQKYEVTLITDALTGYFIGQADIVMVGADSILSNGSVVNKVGTYLIALAAKGCGIPVYALCQTNKFYAKSYFGETIELEEKQASEILKESIPNVCVRNIYFENTPSELITGIITEKGILKPNELSTRFNEMAEYLKALK